jgi:glycosyltransferase involved in cell wall biosynthesis
MRFVREALFSVVNQTYPHVELIVVDDASTDDSISNIQLFIDEYPHVQLIVNESNLGNCRSFNLALSKAKGKYIIDLAADDILLDTRIEKQVNCFENLSTDYGVIYTNAIYINEQSVVISTHYPIDEKGKAKRKIPSGDIYKQIMKSYFICTPTMIMRKKILDELGGYDDKLSYEDFDFWVRSARTYKYFYQDEILTFKRKVKGSLSSKFYQRRQNKHLASTLEVCHKAFALNRDSSENLALASTLRYHLRQSFYTQNFDLVFQFASLLKQVDNIDFVTHVILFLSKYEINVWWAYKIYIRFLQLIN